MGDLNDHLHTSRTLASVAALNVYRVSDNSPTTLDKRGVLTKRGSIDHCYINSRALDCPTHVRVEPSIVSSDHVPIILDLAFQQLSFAQAGWPKPVKNISPTRINVPYMQWHVAAKMWLSEARQQTLELSPSVSSARSPFSSPSFSYLQEIAIFAASAG